MACFAVTHLEDLTIIISVPCTLPQPTRPTHWRTTRGTLDEPEGAGYAFFLLTGEVLKRAPHWGPWPVQLRGAQGGAPRLTAIVLLAIALG